MPPGAADGHEGFKRVLGVFRDAFPDLTLTIDFIVADDERLVAYVTTTGTHQGSFMGAPPTGKRFKAQSADIFAFNAAGLVVVVESSAAHGSGLRATRTSAPCRFTAGFIEVTVSE